MAKRCTSNKGCNYPRSRFWKKALAVDWFDHNNTDNNSGGGGVDIDSEYDNGSGEVLFVSFGDSMGVDSNNSSGPGPDPNGAGKIWNGTSFVNLGTVGPGDSGVITGRTDGSIWQQFCIDYHARTGKVACLVVRNIGGTKIYDTWNGTSATYNTAVSEVQAAMTAGNFSSVRFIIHVGVNDSTAGDAQADVISRFGTLISSINTTFSTPKIYYVMYGVKNTQGVRAPAIRAGIREHIITYTNVHVPYREGPLNPWGYIGADGVHRTQDGNNFAGSKIDDYLELEYDNPTFDRFALSIINGQYSASSWTQDRKNAVNTAISGLIADNVWHNMLGYWCGDVLHANDRHVDWCMTSVITDRGATVNIDSNIETNTGQTLNIPITPSTVPYRTHANTDTFISVRLGDYKSAVSGTKILCGVSSGTNIYGIQVGSTGTITFYCWSSSGPTKTGGAQDNTRYTVGRNAGDVKSYINGVSNGTSAVAAGSALTNGPEIGDRYTSGPAGFAVNSEYKDFCMGLDSAVDQAALYSRLETMFASI